MHHGALYNTLRNGREGGFFWFDYCWQEYSSPQSSSQTPLAKVNEKYEQLNERETATLEPTSYAYALYTCQNAADPSNQTVKLAYKYITPVESL